MVKLVLCVSLVSASVAQTAQLDSIVDEKAAGWPFLDHLGDDCFAACGGVTGKCPTNFCGSGGWCCRWGMEWDTPGCYNVGCHGKHCCTQKGDWQHLSEHLDSTVNHIGDHIESDGPFGATVDHIGDHIESDGPFGVTADHIGDHIESDGPFGATADHIGDHIESDGPFGATVDHIGDHIESDGPFGATVDHIGDHIESDGPFGATVDHIGDHIESDGPFGATVDHIGDHIESDGPFGTTVDHIGDHIESDGPFGATVDHIGDHIESDGPFGATVDHIGDHIESDGPFGAQLASTVGENAAGWPFLDHLGDDCFAACGGVTGKCPTNFCGSGGWCCRFGMEWDTPGCYNVGCHFKHCCTQRGDWHHLSKESNITDVMV